MGLFDSLFGTNTAAGTTSGAQAGILAIGQGSGAGNHALRNTTQQANQALTGNTQAGLGALGTGYGNAVTALQGAGSQAQGILSRLTNQGVTSSEAGNNLYQPAATAGGSASTMLGNALGLNGAAGSAAAKAAFQTSPGYEFQQQQAADQTARQMGALGLAGSGTTLNAILNGSSNLANTEYQNYLSNLSGTANQGLTAATGISTNDRTAGTLQASSGQTGAQLAQNLGQSIGTADTGLANNQATLYGNLGAGLSGNLTSEGQHLSQNDMSSALASAQLALDAGQAQDSATNTNNGIFSNLLSSVLGTQISPTTLTSSNGSTTTSGMTLGGSILKGLGI